MSQQILHPKTLKVLGFAKQGALSKLTSKRSCQWANRLIVATIEAVEEFEAVKGFYYSAKRVDPQDMFSRYLQRKGGCLDLWQAACGACIDEKTPPGQDEAEVLDVAGGALWQLLFCTFGVMTGPFAVADCSGVAINMKIVAEQDNAANRKALKTSIQYHTLNIAETCYRLTILEYETWYRHKSWPIDWTECVQDGAFDKRSAVEALYPALKAFDESHPTAFSDIYFALHGLNHESGDAPRAFVFTDSPKAPLHTFDQAVVALLTMETEFVFRYPPDLAKVLGYREQPYVPSSFLQKSRGLFLYQLYANIRKNAEKAPSDVSRRMWLEAAAELLQNMSMRQPVYTREAAERILSLANRAQRESWIERMMARTKEKKEVEPTVFAQQSPVPEKVEPAVIERTVNDKIAAFVDGLLAQVAGAGGKGGKGKNGKGNDKKDGTGKGKGRGRQTETTIKQFARFQAYLNKHHVVQHCSLETLKSRVNSFWLENKDEFKAAASKKGQEKGYCSAAMILRAARDKGYGPPSGQ